LQNSQVGNKALVAGQLAQAYPTKQNIFE